MSAADPPLIAADARAILVPFSRVEAAEVSACAAAANVDVSTARRWAIRYGLGRKIAGRFYMSRVAFAMFIAGDWPALRAYHAGDRSTYLVEAYFRALL